MVLFLTGCINPEGMLYTSLNDKEKRMEQYLTAINYYLSNTKYKIIFTENSGTDISFYFKEHIQSKRLECITFNGNKEKSRGKGYGEAEIFKYTLEHSQTIKKHCESQQIVKITGRLIVKNINRICLFHRVFLPKEAISCAINSDFSFPDSRIFISSAYFLRTFTNNKECINDAKGYYFEHALCDMIKNNKQFPFCPFFIQPQILGSSGSTGENYTYKHHSFIYSLRYAKYAASQLNRFYKLYR